MQLQPAEIAAYASLTVALLSALVTLFVARSNQRAQADLEELKTTLGEQSKERDARRDYEYDARKRLYTELEPLLFRFVDASDEAWHRILSLARSIRLEAIRSTGGSLADEDRYYFRSTIYKLLVPMAILRLAEEKLTFVDLAVEPRLRDQYFLMKTLDRSFTDDYVLAGIDPKLLYDPNHPDAEELREHDPAQYWRQGMFLGGLDRAASALIVRPASEPARVMRFGDFNAALNDTQNGLREAFDHVVEIFTLFHPKTRPVLWRLLVTQATIYQSFIALRSSSRTAAFDPFRQLGAADLDLLTWNGDKADEELKQTAAIAREHIRATFRRIAGPR